MKLLMNLSLRYISPRYEKKTSKKQESCFPLSLSFLFVSNVFSARQSQSRETYSEFAVYIVIGSYSFPAIDTPRDRANFLRWLPAAFSYGECLMSNVYVPVNSIPRVSIENERARFKIR